MECRIHSGCASSFMAFLAFAFLLSVFTFTNAAVGECDPSMLGYRCMKTLADYYNIHWTLQGDDLFMALEGIGAEWVGFSFPQVPEKMAPADAVIGWLDVNGPSVLPYNLVATSVFAQDEDFAITLRNVSAIQDSERTIVAFTRSTREGRIEINVDKDMPINFAIGDEDALRHHIQRGSSTILLSAEPGKGRTAAARPPPLVESVVTPNDTDEDAVIRAEPSLREATLPPSRFQDFAVASAPTPEATSQALASEEAEEDEETIGLMLDDLN